MVSGRLFIIFLYLLSVLIFKKLLFYFAVHSNDPHIFNFWEYNEQVDDIYDYIIVGYGSAGASVANRLAEDKTANILVLEAGLETKNILDIPSVGLLLQGTFLDWQYETVPQKSCYALENNRSKWPMGKIAGGTSMLNNMIYVRGHRKDFDDWFRDKEDYNYSDILYYFNKAENRHNEDNSTKPIFINDLSFTSLLQKHILDAGKNLGFNIYEDITDCRQGFGKPKATLHNGQRWTSAHHLKYSPKPNIRLKTNAFVEKIILKNNFEAQGVIYHYFDKIYQVKARRGVILSAGVIGTPKILMLSGIGPKKHLNDIKIESKVDLPVGENLQDHVTTGFDLVLLNQTLDIGLEEMLSPVSAFDYFWNNNGPWTTGGCEVVGFFNTQNIKNKIDDNGQPDLQLMVMPLGITEDMGYHLRHLIGISDYSWENYFAMLNGTKAITILPILLHPKSKGSVKLKNNNINTPPIINPNYLSKKEDIDVLISGIELVKQIIQTKDMQKLGPILNTLVFPGCEHHTFDSKAYWECYVKQMTITSYHPIGTCKMGSESDRSAVVNFDFEVKGTNKLFVVDGSVMPSLTSGNINGAVYMLAEMGADCIKKKYFYLSINKCYYKDVFMGNDNKCL